MNKIVNNIICCNKPIKILILISIIIGFYNIILRYLYKDKFIYHDILNKKIFNLDILENCCSGWTLSHFILFFILGLLFPDCIVVILIISVLWEFIEVFIGHYVNGNNWKRQITRNNGNIEYSTNWWAGSYKDILVNILGFMTGYVLIKTYKKNNIQ
jgi:hypothetical protein